MIDRARLVRKQIRATWGDLEDRAHGSMTNCSLAKWKRCVR